jgi:hypothetical protein
MKQMACAVQLVALCLLLGRGLALGQAEEEPIVEVQGPTVIAFFAPVSAAEMEKDPDTNEVLADFQVYAARLREPLRKAGVQFEELYVHSFRLRVGNSVTGFRPAKVDVGYYFVMPGKKPRIECGVLTDVDILEEAQEYFGNSIR